MRIINGNCIPSVTEIMRAAAHCRALAAEAHYSGRIAAYWDLDDGSMSYHEFIGGGWLQSLRRVEVASADTGRGLLYAGTAADRRTDAAQVRAEMLHAVQHLSAAYGGGILTWHTVTSRAATLPRQSCIRSAFSGPRAAARTVIIARGIAG